jgi:hypothetical protein
MVQAVGAGSGATAGGSPLLSASDTFVVAGCAFAPGGVPHPCTTVQWVQPAARFAVGGAPALTAQSVGLCQAADQAVQGTVLVVATQPQAGGI